MQLEYFQLIDRIVDLNVGERTITVEAQVPQHSTIFEGHFPGYPIMPGVLLIEAMAQTAGWLLLALMNFERMPFLAAVKEAKMRGFVTPGEVLTVEANLVHEGSGYAITEASVSGPAEVWITGSGLATSLGEGLDANWEALNQGRVNVDEKAFAPYVVHPWAPLNLDKQIPKKG